MKAVLERLVTTPGVRAAAVFDRHGICLHAEGEVDVAVALSRSPDSLFSPAQGERSFLSRERVSIARFIRGTIVVRRSPDIVLIVLCDPRIDLGVGVVGFHIAVAFKVLNIRAASRRPPRSSGTVPAAIGSTGDELPAAIPALKVPRV